MQALRIAFLPLIRTTFDVPMAEAMIRAARQSLLAAGFELTGPEQALTDLSSAQSAATDLASTPVDLLLVFQATFADSTMAVALTEKTEAPVFLWAMPEPWTGERLRLNSLCGINLAGHALTLRERAYEYAYAAPDDVTTLQHIRTLALAGRLRRNMKSARLGVVGEHPAGMDSCHLDEPGLNQIFGIQIQRIDLNDVFQRARSTPAADLSQVRSRLDTYLDNLATLDQTPLNGTLSIYSALKEIATEQKLDGLAVRCWPEFFTEMGCAACGAMSMLSDGLGQDAPLPCSCEADINGTVTQLMLQTLAGTPAFGTDMVAVDFEKDALALWHCGLAPFSMADPAVQARGGIHSNRRVPLVMEFPLKPGPVTIARLSQATGELRLVLARGEMLASPKPFSGTSGTLRLSGPVRDFLDVLMKEGLEHHVSLVYGNYLKELQVFASLVGLPVLNC